MSWLDRLPWRKSRAAIPAQEIYPTTGSFFGLGIGTQPTHESLLRENQGVADMATRAIANRVASLSLEVVEQRRRRAGTAVDEVLDDHPLGRLLERPHPNLTMAQMLRLAAQHLVTVGEGYWLKVSNGLRLPAELHPLPPGNVWPVVSRGVIEAYRFKDGNGAMETLAPDTVVRFWLPDPESPFESEGYLGPNATATDAQKFQKEHLRTLYQNDSIPAAFFQAREGAEVDDPSEGSWRTFLEVWQQRYNRRHGTNAGAPAKVPPGWEVIFAAMQTGVEITPLLEYFTREQLMNFGVPRSVLGEVVSGDRASAEVNQFVMDLHTITPLATQIADALTLQLAVDFDPRLSVRFAEFVSSDKEFDLKKEAQDAGLMKASPNQLLEREGEDPVPWGELPIATVGQVPFDGSTVDDFEPDEADALGDPEDEPPESGSEPEPDEDEERTWEARAFLAERLYSGVMRKRLQRIVRRQERVTMRRLEDQVPRARVDVDSIFKPAEWDTMFAIEVVPVYREVLQRSGTDALASIAPRQDFILTEAMVEVIEREGSLLSQRTGETTRGRLERALVDSIQSGEAVGQRAKRIGEVFAGRRRNTRTIARTEVLRANQAGQMEGFRASGVVRGKRWNTSQDEKVRDSHVPLDGVELPINEPFDVEGFPADAPGDSSLPARHLINCRCFVTPVLMDDPS